MSDDRINDQCRRDFISRALPVTLGPVEKQEICLGDGNLQL